MFRISKKTLKEKKRHFKGFYSQGDVYEESFQKGVGLAKEVFQAPRLILKTRCPFFKEEEAFLKLDYEDNFTITSVLVSGLDSLRIGKNSLPQKHFLYNKS